LTEPWESHLHTEGITLVPLGARSRSTRLPSGRYAQNR
jgi:hypothetical protein